MFFVIPECLCLTSVSHLHRLTEVQKKKKTICKKSLMTLKRGSYRQQVLHYNSIHRFIYTRPEGWKTKKFVKEKKMSFVVDVKLLPPLGRRTGCRLFFKGFNDQPFCAFVIIMNAFYWVRYPWGVVKA